MKLKFKKTTNKRGILPISGETHSSRYRFFTDTFCKGNGSTFTVSKLMIWFSSEALMTVVKLEYEVLLVERI